MSAARRPTRVLAIATILAASAVAALGASAGAAGKRGAAAPGAESAAHFSFGQLQAGTIGASGCGENKAGEPAIHVSRADNVFLGSELGIGSGSELWRGLGAVGGKGASGCGLEYRGQPNAVSGKGASGGDVDVAVASEANGEGNYNVYVSSLNLASVSVATSKDNAATFSQTPVQAGLPVDDREWIAAFGAKSSLLTFHQVATNNIEVLRSDNEGQTYAKVATAIPIGDYKEQHNELGNLVIDHRNLPDSTGGFYAYQSFVAPSNSTGEHNNEAFLAVSSDGGHSWTDRPIPCSTESASTDLNHNFPNVSVGPAGDLWYAWSDDRYIRTAVSTDHGQTWRCSRIVSRGSAQAIFPWLAATSAGVDLVYYGAPTASGQTFYVDFVQNPSGKPSGWLTPKQIVAVHRGAVCEEGATCTTGRQLFDDFGLDTDMSGWAHIAYSHDSPELGGEETYTGYAVQTGGRALGEPNN
ncbi:MAG: sialidase family protein [Solirubrobacteraceae bacterium]